MKSLTSMPFTLSRVLDVVSEKLLRNLDGSGRDRTVLNNLRIPFSLPSPCFGFQIFHVGLTWDVPIFYLNHQWLVSKPPLIDSDLVGRRCQCYRCEMLPTATLQQPPLLNSTPAHHLFSIGLLKDLRILLAPLRTNPWIHLRIPTTPGGISIYLSLSSPPFFFYMSWLVSLVGRGSALRGSTSNSGFRSGAANLTRWIIKFPGLQVSARLQYSLQATTYRNNPQPLQRPPFSTKDCMYTCKHCVNKAERQQK